MAPKKSRRNTALIIAALLILVLLIAETALVVTVFISPTASKNLSARLVDFKEAWEGKDGQPGIPERFKTSVNDFYESQIMPLWQAPKPTSVKPTFATCEGCHQDYATTKRFPSVYMDHPAHAQAGMSCAECHTEVAHPNPPVPTEAVCARCHDEVNTKDECDFCHPPGGLAHFYLLGAPRQGVIACATCHPKDKFEATKKDAVPIDVGTFNGDPSTRCMQCHVAQNTCVSCHGTEKKPYHPSDWIKTHGLDVGEGAGSSTCAGCHETQYWCTSMCHVVMPKQPLPTEVPTT